MLLQIIFGVLLFLVFLVLCIDLVPLAKDWVLRIHIGRYQDQKTWNSAIMQRGIKWLYKTPKIKVTDNTRFIVLDMLKGNYTKSAIQHWQQASLLLGIQAYVKKSDDTQAKEAVRHWLSHTFDKNGQWKEKPQYVDGAIVAYALMKLDWIDMEQYRPALDYTWEMVQSHLGEEGTVQYRKFMKNYRYVDTIGFICPFLIAYGTKYEKEECITLAVKQIAAYQEKGMLAQHAIPCHAYHVQNSVPLGLYGWGRGLGWYAIGLIDAWDELPSHHIYKQQLEAYVVEFAKGAMQFQQPGGYWGWTVTRSESNADSSVTATLAWFMTRAAQIPVVTEMCTQSKERALQYMMQVTRKNGAVDFSQGDTKDIGVYSQHFNILPFTQGFCIRTINNE